MIARDFARLPVGTVLLWQGAPAVRREREGWRYLAVDGTPQRWLGDNEVDGLHLRDYTVAR